MSIYYGVVDPDHIHTLALAVCDALGHGKNHNALQLLKGTAAQETAYGSFRDPSEYGAGVGLCQCDPIAFRDVQARTRPAARKALQAQFDIDLDAVTHQELAFSPLLAMVWCRLHYKLVPELIPSTVPGLADYWKKYYNTSAGKGTPDEFIEKYYKYVG